ncbi:hypothetical protein Nmel_016436 [Mimus melanotis]
MESALFLPTATMANLIAVMCHCQRRGAQLFLGQGTHLYLYEHGGAAQVAGVHCQALPDLPDGTLDLEQLELAIREAHGSRYYPRPELICLENTHSSAGGRALPLTYLSQVRATDGAGAILPGVGSWALHNGSAGTLELRAWLVVALDAAGVPPKASAPLTARCGGLQTVTGCGCTWTAHG